LFWLAALAAVVLVPLVAGSLWLLAFGNRPVVHRHRRLAGFEPMLRQLAHLMADGTLYVIEVHRTSVFLQFIKQADGVLLGIPDAPWSRARFEVIEETLRRSGVPVDVVDTGSMPVTRFLHARFSGDPETIAAMAVHAATLAAEALKVPPESDYRGHYEGTFDPAAVLSTYGEQYEQLAHEGPRPFRRIFASQLQGWQAASANVPDDRSMV
jgi:hypothetical protein